jgi:hypothetical protein
MCLPLLAAIGCGGGSSGTASCGGEFEVSCDVPNDNGVHTCYDVTALDGPGLQQAKMTCTGPGTNGSVLPACCNHDTAIARCLFSTASGSSTEWFLSGGVGQAQSACQGKTGVFTSL